MQAIVVQEAGNHEQLSYQTVERPQIKANELLIRVHYTAVNRTDIINRENFNGDPQKAILGAEVAGEVVEVGSDCQHFAVGDRVMALVGAGGYAEYCTAVEDHVLPLPETMSYREAAAIPEVFLTAYQTLFWLGKLSEGETVLIHAGASGVGTAAIQLAKQVVGAQVIVTAGSPEKLEFCRDLGADVTINYKTQSFDKEVQKATDSRGVDLILDFIGASYWDKNMASVAVDGRWVLIGILGGAEIKDVNLMDILAKRIQITGTLLTPRSEEYKAQLIQDFTEQIEPYFDRQAIRPIIDTEFALSQMSEAHQYMEANRNIGKIVIRVVEDN